MSAHTAGPWQVKSEHEPEYIIGAIDGPDDGTMYYRPVAMVSETDDFDANARLIAAAPDLLRGCLEVVRALQALTTKQQRGFYDIGLQNALKAIAKATGEPA